MNFTKLPPISVPRLNSLRYRLQKARAPMDGLPYLDQLMIFLEDPPPGINDRWKAGAKMCAAWGITCSGASVWRLYRAYGFEWRVRVQLENEGIRHESTDALTGRARHMIALRTYEILANPGTPPEDILFLARLGIRRTAHNFAVKKYRARLRTGRDVTPAPYG